jgi:ligand-binding sensor domain-containing protein/signal transduction histidine kinase
MPNYLIPRLSPVRGKRVLGLASGGIGGQGRGMPPVSRLLAAFVSGVILFLGFPATGEEAPRLRPEVHPRRNVEQFPPVEAQWVRMTIQRATRAEPCLDEFEIYGPDEPEVNLALAERGTRVRASGTLGEYRIHALSHLNDGLYGNARSWICDSTRDGWIEFQLPGTTVIDRIVWSRDREGKFIDRLPVEYRIEVAALSGEWTRVATSEDRIPSGATSESNPGLRHGVNYLPWISGVHAGEPEGRASAARREYMITGWNTAHGLPSNTVTALACGADGWLWIGTAQGLSRFDGVRFTTFGEKDGLPDLNIGALCEDHSGRLWVGTMGGGVAWWDGGSFQSASTGSSAASRTVTGLSADASGALWISTLDGVFELRGEVASRKLGGVIPAVACDPKGEGAWFCREGLMHSVGGETEVIDPSIERARFTSLDALAVAPDGSVWFGGANRYVGLLKDDKVEVFAEDAAALTSTVRNILPRVDGDVWLGTSGSGLIRLRGRDLLSVTTEDGLPSNSVSALCEDTEGNLWVGTTGGGVARISARRVAVVAPADGLSHPAVMALAEDADGSVWIGTNGGGLNQWKDGSVKPFSPNYVLENETIVTLASSPEGGLLIGTAFSGLAQLDHDGFRFLPASTEDPGTSIRALAAEGEGGWWVASARGLFRVRDDEITRPAGLEALAGHEITSLACDGRGTLWIGTGGAGLFRLIGGKELRSWSVSEGLPGAFIRTLQFDARGTLWAGTSGGLCRWNGDGFDNFTGDHGLPEALVSQILDDGGGNLWFGTNRGVLRIARSSFDAVASGTARRLEILALDATDGLPSLECAAGSNPGCLRLSDGRLCFGTAAGLAVIDSSRFPSRAAPPVVLESITLGDGKARLPAGDGSGAFESVTDGSVEIAFTAPSHTAPQRVRFRWWLEGLDAGWSEPSSERSVSYRHLPHGKYHFHVAASRDGGAWSDPDAAFLLTVPVPWWASRWAIAGGLVAGGIGVAAVSRFFARRRMRNRLRQVEQAFALESERSRIARDIHDTLGANLTRIALHSAVGQAESDRPEVAAEHFSAISATAGELVQSLDGIVWAVNPVHDTLESLAHYLMRFAEEFCAALPVRLRLDVAEELPAIALRSEVRHNILLAARETLNNAVRHAGASEIRLSLDVSGGTLRIVITDDGTGFDPANAASGNGIANIHRRLAHCGGTCRFESAIDRGVRVLFFVPLQDSVMARPVRFPATLPFESTPRAIRQP